MGCEWEFNHLPCWNFCNCNLVVFCFGSLILLFFRINVFLICLAIQSNFIITTSLCYFFTELIWDMHFNSPIDRFYVTVTSYFPLMQNSGVKATGDFIPIRHERWQIDLLKYSSILHLRSVFYKSLSYAFPWHIAMMALVEKYIVIFWAFS